MFRHLLARTRASLDRLTTALHRPAFSTSSSSSATSPTSFWKRWTAARPDHPKFSAQWYGEKTLQCIIFGIAGSGSMYMVCREQNEFHSVVFSIHVILLI
jgi:hypothetical protein